MIHAATHKVFASLSSGLLAAGITLLGEAAATQISDKWLIDIRTAISVGGTVLIATWWLGQKFQKIEDRLQSAEAARAQMQADIAELVKAHRSSRRH